VVERVGVVARGRRSWEVKRRSRLQPPREREEGGGFNIHAI